MTDGAAAPRRLLVVQYAGDYAEAWHRLQQGGEETYFAQAYSVDAVAARATRGAEVAVLVAITERAYRETLSARLTAVGLGPAKPGTEDAIIDFARNFRPTHVLLRVPFRRVLRWACDSDVRILLTLADSFNGGIRNWLQSRRLARLMNHARVDWVSNHGIASSAALVKMGVDAAKVIPWDWPHVNSPEQWQARTLNTGRRVFKALYVGARVELKGVGDAIRAVALLAGRGMEVHLDVIGDGDDFSSLADSLKVTDRVVFRGRVANAAIIGAMRKADVVLVPSRKEYPEGFPLTLYEALCARTPIVASDHPMFLPKLSPDRSAVIFPAGDVDALARSIERLLSSPDLYRALSLASLETWQSLQVPVKWADLVVAWFDDSPGSREWLRGNAMDRSSND